MLGLGSGHLCTGERVEVGMDLEWATWGAQEEWMVNVCVFLRAMEETESTNVGIRPRSSVS